MSLADQKVEKTPIQSWGLGFWDLVSLAEQKTETTPIQSWDSGFEDSVSFADQKVETTPHPKLELSFFELCIYSKLLTAILSFPTWMVSR